MKLDSSAESLELFRATASSDENRLAFAEAWGAMISEVLPVESTVRSIFTVENVPAGAVPVYQSDIQPVSAWMLPKWGQHPINVVETEEVTVTTFQVVGDVTYKMRDAEQARISVAERAMQRLKDSIVSYEETAGWAVIKAAVQNDKTVSLSGNVGLTKAVANDAFRLMEADRGYKVTDIFLNPRALSDFRSWKATDIDPQTQREYYQAGGDIGNLWGANIHLLYELAETEAYFIDASPNKLGYMPIRKEFETYDDPTAIKSFNIGVFGREEIGFVVMDANAIVKATLAY